MEHRSGDKSGLGGLVSPVGADSGKRELLLMCKGKADWSELPSCLMEVPNWRELLGKKK